MTMRMRGTRQAGGIPYMRPESVVRLRGQLGGSSVFLAGDLGRSWDTFASDFGTEMGHNKKTSAAGLMNDGSV